MVNDPPAGFHRTFRELALFFFSRARRLLIDRAVGCFSISVCPPTGTCRGQATQCRGVNKNGAPFFIPPAHSGLKYSCAAGCAAIQLPKTLPENCVQLSLYSAAVRHR